VLCGVKGAYAIEDGYYCDYCVSSGHAESHPERGLEVANTPPLRKWQDWDWPFCCGETCIHVCELAKDNVSVHAAGVDQVLFIQEHLEAGPEPEVIWEYLRPVDRKSQGGDRDCDLNRFVCGKCGRKLIIWDAN